MAARNPAKRLSTEGNIFPSASNNATPEKTGQIIAPATAKRVKRAMPIHDEPCEATTIASPDTETVSFLNKLTASQQGIIGYPAINDDDDSPLSCRMAVLEAVGLISLEDGMVATTQPSPSQQSARLASLDDEITRLSRLTEQFEAIVTTNRSRLPCVDAFVSTRELVSVHSERCLIAVHASAGAKLEVPEPDHVNSEYGFQLKSSKAIDVRVMGSKHPSSSPPRAPPPAYLAPGVVKTPIPRVARDLNGTPKMATTRTRTMLSDLQSSSPADTRHTAARALDTRIMSPVRETFVSRKRSETEDLGDVDSVLLSITHKTEFAHMTDVCSEYFLTTHVEETVDELFANDYEDVWL
eukprot:TRINITY_DN11660_c1_g12_i1.p1 TRINITY_DN11660_c1_g12~~TRINITY_DN11660_c1_g12_i1.p1  ORF type:complete len:354 (+),score=49.11 TRINITY_DN11660_c1_g12_i1:57-1118(+)